MHSAVIIPYFPQGRHETLNWTLEGFGLQELARGNSLEILVGIDGQADRIPIPAFSTARHGITQHPLPRMGAAAVRNELVRRIQITPDLLIFANADTRPEPDMVQQHVAAMARLPERSLVLGAAPWERHNPSVLDTLIDSTPMVFSYCHLKARQGHSFRVAYSLNLSVRYLDFCAAGGFPESVRPYYYEDLAFAYRVLGPEQAGVFYAPQARVLHRHELSLAQYLDREELLGIMAPVLAETCPEVFAVLMAGRSLQQLASDFRNALEANKAIYPPLFSHLQAKFALLRSTLGVGEVCRQSIQRLYQLHLPLKLLAFRLGLLQGIQWRHDRDWQERRAGGRWRPWVRAEPHQSTSLE